MSSEILHILKEARSKKVKIGANNGSLTLKSITPIEPDLLQKIKDNKALIVEYIERSRAKNKREKGTEITPYDRLEQKRIPLSFSQERLWFLDQLQGSTDYHIPFVMKLTGDLNEEVLCTSLQEIVCRHEVLRTVIASEGGIGYQKLLPADNWTLEREDIGTAHHRALPSRLDAFLSRPFDLGADYMFRSCLFDLGAGVYVLAGVFHHIASDGWSEGILVQEFTALYRAHSSGASSALPELPLQYMDYALWQRQHLAGAVLEQQLSYWEGHLKGAIPLQLSTDYARPAVQSTSGAMASLDLDPALSDAIKALSQKEGVTTFMTLLAGFKVLLSRYSGQSDISVGTPIANRTQRELEHLIGFFVNTLVLRNNLDPFMCFSELLSDIRSTTLTAYDHQSAPFEKVVERVADTRDMSRSPLFQVMFVMQNTPDAAEMELGGVTMTPYEEEGEHFRSQFDLTLSVREKKDGFSLVMEYCNDLFRKDTIVRMLSHYQELLQAIVKDPSMPLHSLSMLSEEEQQYMRDVSKGTVVDFSKNRTIVDLFLEQVEKSPDNKAIVFEGSSMNYRELDEKSNQWAHYLIQQGLQTEGLVGICMERSLEVIVAIFGVLKAGGAYVPIDIAYPKDRIDYMLKDSGVGTVVCDADGFSKFSGKDTLSIIATVDHRDTIDTMPKSTPERAITSQSLAYVIYTSGSTGNPKGVMIEHRNTVSLLQWAANQYDKKEMAAMLASTSLSFDLFAFELFVPLIFGGTVYLVKDLFSLSEVEAPITFINTVPSVIDSFMASNSIPDTVLTVNLAGEPLSADLVNRLYELGTITRVNDLYGPSECTTYATFSARLKNGIATIGRPLSNTSIHIVDSTMNLVPIGVQGELCISGAGLARGYLNNTIMTDEKFVENPFVKGARMYRTGDLARWLPDGNIEFMGRRDNQVKISGYRIELGEIEAQLSKVPGVGNCCVVAGEGPDGYPRLVGYVTPLDAVEREEIQAVLKQHLPEYMVPRLWVLLEEMPLTQNGKVDRTGLPSPENFGLSSREYVGPRNNFEERMATIWQELLGLEKVGIHDNFFELGGHSLLIVRLISRVQQLGYEVSVRDFYRSPSIAALYEGFEGHASVVSIPANGIEEGCTYITPDRVSLVDLDQEELDTIMSIVPGGGANIQDIYPLSPLQEGLYFHHLMSHPDKGDPYILPNLMRFSSLKGRADFIAALRRVVARHDVLRTGIQNEGLSTAVQVVLRQVALPIEELPLIEGEDVLAQMNRRIAPENLWMNVANGPLLKLQIADDIESDAYYLILLAHHMIIDHVGMEKITEEIRTHISGDDHQLPAPSQYRDFIGDIRYNYAIEESEAYFRSLLKGVETPTYPFGLSDVSGDGATELTSFSEFVPEEMAKALRNTAGNLQMSPAVLFHAAFGIVVGKCSNKDHAIFGSLFSGRLQASANSRSALGLFINTLPVLVNLHGSVQEYVAQVEERLSELLPHEQSPLSTIQKWSDIPNDIPLFSTLLNYRHSMPTAAPTMDADTGVEVLSAEERTNYPLIVNVDDYGNAFELTAKVAHHAVSPSKIMAYLLEVLSAMMRCFENDLQEQVAELSILPKSERQHLLEVCNNTTLAYPEDSTLVDLFEEQVSRTPESIAILFGGEAVTYRDLDNKSNQLGRYLIEQGVQVKDRVGIGIERSPEMIIGVLGVLKSGAAYVPIDTDYPQSRIDYMLKDAGIRLVLSDALGSAKFSAKGSLSVIQLDDHWHIIEKQSDSALGSDISPRDMAYVMYTSGSTGSPKGVWTMHRNIVKLAMEKGPIAIHSTDRVLQWSNLVFDGSVYDIFSSLLNGAGLCLITKKAAADPKELSKIIEEQKLSVVFLTTALFNLFVDNDLEALARLRKVLFGGQLVSMPHVERAYAHLGPKKLVHVYGPTETVVYATCYEIDAAPTTAVPIGRPLSNTHTYILDPSQNLLPVGAIGELCISGAGVAGGYLNNEPLTQKAFVENPFAKEQRMYRTGDLARWLPDGDIEFIGRKDDQVKVRGYRIELGEVESQLSKIEEVKSCSVKVNKGPDGNWRLIGYVVPSNPSEGSDGTAIAARLKENLPEYMVPQLWILLKEMPLTRNGKVDKNALPAPEDVSLSSQEYLAPRTILEEQLVAIWQELLAVEKIGIHDNFFQLGGHSLLIIRLISQIQQLGYEVNVRDIYRSPSIASLSEVLTVRPLEADIPANGIEKDCTYITPERVPLTDLSQEELDTVMSGIPGGARNIQDIYPLSPLQEGLYFHHLMSTPDQGDPYILPSLMRFSSSDDREAFTAALQLVVDRHDVLRTCVLNTGLSSAVQVVLRRVELSLEKLSFEGHEEILPRLEREIAPENLWMDLSTAPLLKLKVAEDVENGAYYLLLSIHHLIIDHVGMEKITEEIMHHLSGNTDKLTAPPLYRNFIGNIRHHYSEEESRRYFRTLLQGIEEPTYPFDMSDIHGDGATNREVGHVILPQEMSSALRRIAHNLQTSPAVLFHAAFGLVIGRCSNKDHALFGSLFSGRLQGTAGADSSLGLFINTLPVLVNLKGSVTEYITQVKNRLQSMLPYEQTPLSTIHQWSDIANDVPFFSVLMNYRHDTSMPIAGTTANDDFDMEVLSGGERTNYPLSFDIDDHGDDFGLRVQIANDTVEAAHFIAYVQEALSLLLTHYERGGEVSVEDLSILPETVQQQLLEDFNTTAIDYTDDSTVLTLFEEQARNKPEATALVFGEEELTYAAVDKRSNQLAHYLRAQGIEQGDLVGICMERSPEMVVGVLGILKSGAAYVPIDIDYPTARVNYIIEDTSLGLVLCDVKTSSLFEKISGLSLLIPDTRLLDTYATDRLSITISEDTLAYIIYTSGTTGTPKGVMIKRSSLYNLLQWYNTYFQMDEGLKVLQLTKLVIDIAYQEIFSTLINGGVLCIPEERKVLDRDYIRTLIIDQAINFVQLIPDTLSVYLEDGARLSSLRHVLVGGDRLSASLGNTIVAKGYELYNIYGQTESTIDLLVSKVGPDSFLFRDKVSNNRIYILDRHQRLLPIGAIGELCVGGYGVAKGYRNKEELTSKKFIADPFREGELMYRTGDLARYWADGSIEFIGRKDNQVKIRGYRVELGEVENALSLQHSIETCCVLPQSDTAHESSGLIAYIKPKKQLFENTKTGTSYHCKLHDGSAEMYGQMEDIHSSSWADFFEGSSVLKEYWRRIYTTFSDLQIGIYDEEEKLIAVGNTVPLQWSKELPSLGWDDAIKKAFEDKERCHTADTLCILSGVVDENYMGKGYSRELVKRMGDLAMSRGFAKLVVPVRPILKHQHPSRSIEEYGKMKNEQGATLDPWVRLHENLGGRVIGYSEHSQRIEGDINQWEAWTSQRYTKSGIYTFDKGMQAVHIDVDNDTGTYFEQAIWFEHNLDLYQRDAVFHSLAYTKSCLKNKLPDYMVPQLWVELDEMPLTDTGKIDKKALPPPEGHDLVHGSHYIAPRNEIEKQLARIWEKLLGIEKVGIHDNFFELGGHSLMATRLVSILRKELDIEVAIKDIFEYTSLEQLGDYVQYLTVKEKAADNIVFKQTI